MSGFKHFAKDEAEQILRDALDIVEKLAPPEPLTPILFDKAVQMLSAKTIERAQALPIAQGILRGPHPKGGV